MPAQQNTYARAREAFRAQAFGGAFGGMAPAKNQGTSKTVTGSQALASLQKGSQLAAGGNGPLGYEVGDRVRHVKFGEGTVISKKADEITRLRLNLTVSEHARCLQNLPSL